MKKSADYTSGISWPGATRNDGKLLSRWENSTDADMLMPMWHLRMIDILPALQREDSSKRILRLRVSSGAKDAFASSLVGSRPIMTKDVVCSTCSRVKAAFPPMCNRRFNRKYRIPVHGRVFSLLGTTSSVRRPGGPDVVEWASTFLPERVRRRSRRTVEDRNSTPGNVGSIDTAGERLILPFVEYPTLLSSAIAEYGVGFIPALKDRAFSSYLRKRLIVF
jgi:hypothetical protein